MRRKEEIELELLKKKPNFWCKKICAIKNEMHLHRFLRTP